MSLVLLSSPLLSSHSLSTYQMWPRLQWPSLWACLPDLPGFPVRGFLQPTPVLLPQLLLTSWGWGQLWLWGSGQWQGLGLQQGQQETLGHCSTRQFPGQVIKVLIKNRIMNVKTITNLFCTHTDNRERTCRNIYMHMFNMHTSRFRFCWFCHP